MTVSIFFLKKNPALFVTKKAPNTTYICVESDKLEKLQEKRAGPKEENTGLILKKVHRTVIKLSIVHKYYKIYKYVSQ